MQIACHWQCSAAARVLGLPLAFTTSGPAFVHPELPIEALMLLPGSDGSRGLLALLDGDPALLAGGGIGLYLGDPFINDARVGAELARLSVTWIANLPGIAQHDPAFRRDVADVGFTVEAELARLAGYRQQGFRTLAVVSGSEHAASVLSYPADAVLLVQTTSDLQVSFPSLTQRQATVATVDARLREGGLSVPVLPLLTADELQRLPIAALARPDVQSSRPR